MSSKKSSAIIFDFDGTIVESFDHFAQYIAHRANRGTLTKLELEAVRGLSLMATARHFGHAWWRMPGLYYAGRQWVGKYIDEIRLVPGMEQAIRDLHEKHKKLFIVSSNSTENIQRFLELHNLTECFQGVYGNVGFGGKLPVLRRVMRRHHIAAKRTYYVGDEPRDMSAARLARMQPIAVTWGYCTAQTMQQTKPKQLFKEPKDLSNYLKSDQN